MSKALSPDNCKDLPNKMPNDIWDQLKTLKAELYPSEDNTHVTATNTDVVKKRSATVSFKKNSLTSNTPKNTTMNHPTVQSPAFDKKEGKVTMDNPILQSPASNNKVEGKRNGTSPSSFSISQMFKKLASDGLFLKTALKENHNLHKERDEDKKTLLHHISVTGNLECFMILLETAGKQLELQPKDTEGNTPLHCSCHYRHTIISEKLIELGCSTFRRNNMKLTPLDCYIGGAKDLLQLCNDADYDRVQALLSNVPTCVNKRDSDGWTGLHTCAANGWLKGVDLLLRHGMKATLLDKKGRTPGITLLQLPSILPHSLASLVTLTINSTSTPPPPS